MLLKLLIAVAIIALIVLLIVKGAKALKAQVKHYQKLLDYLINGKGELSMPPGSNELADPEGVANALALLKAPNGFFGEWCKEQLSKAQAQSLIDAINALKQMFDTADGAGEIPDDEVGNALSDLINGTNDEDGLVDIAEQLQNEKEEAEIVKKANDLKNQPPPANDDAAKEREEKFNKAKEIIQKNKEAGEKPKFVVLDDVIDNFNDSYGDAPIEIIGTSIGGATEEIDETVIENVIGVFGDLVFGDRTGVSINPSYCIILTFDPPIEDTVGDDIDVITEPANQTLSVSGLASGDPTDIQADWKYMHQDAEGYRIIEGGPFKYIKICNNSDNKVVIKKVERD